MKAVVRRLQLIIRKPGQGVIQVGTHYRAGAPEPIQRGLTQSMRADRALGIPQPCHHELQEWCFYLIT